MAKPAICSSASVARPGDEFLILGPGFWGKGKTVKEASDKAPFTFTDTWILFSVSPKTYINEAGGWCGTPRDHQPIEIDRAQDLRKSA